MPPIELSETEFDALYERQVASLEHFIKHDLIIEFGKAGLHLVVYRPVTNNEEAERDVKVTAFTVANGAWPGSPKIDLVIANDGFACIAGKAWRFRRPDVNQHTSGDASGNYFTEFHAFHDGSDILRDSPEGGVRASIRKNVARRFNLSVGSGAA